MELPPRLHCREVQVEDDFGELTDLIRAAYAPHAASGLRYWATHQTVEDTANRFAAGHGFVGILNGRIVATVTVQEPAPSSKVPLLAEQGTWSFGQFAVAPPHKGRGFGRQIHDFAVAFALQRGCQRMALHTAQPASALIAMYRSWGYAEAGICDWRPHTNYLSVLMLKVLESPPSQLASLDEDAEIEKAWAMETERRLSDIESGAVQTIPTADALAQVRAKLK
jgi:GNAT superfamily N-acetyltransferase